MTDLPPGWATEPLIKHVASRSGDSKIIKGKQSSSPQAGLVQGYSASGPDVWVPKAQWQGPGIVVSAVGARCGKTFQAHGEWTAIANTHVLVPSETCAVDFKWLWYLTNDEDFWIRSGTAQPFVKVKDTLLRPQLIPPLDVQRRIVATLDDHLSRLDKALAEIAKAKSLVEKFAPSLFHRLISDDSHESRKVHFKDFITLQRGFDLPKRVRKSGSVPILGSNGVLGFHNEAKVRGPGVVTGRSGTIGRVHFIEDDFWALNTTLYVKDFKGNYPLFVYEYLQTLDLKHFAGGSTVPSLDRNVLNDVEVEMPSFERQIEISREMALQRESMLEVLTRVSQLDSQFHQLRRSALNVAFTGTLLKEVQ